MGGSTIAVGRVADVVDVVDDDGALLAVYESRADATAKPSVVLAGR